MICPHCNTGVYVNFSESTFVTYESKSGLITHYWAIRHGQCPECKEAIIYLKKSPFKRTSAGQWIPTGSPPTERLAEPQSGSRPCPAEVPADLAKDFTEAAAVLSISPQASAALTRRSLQHLLREYAHTKAKDLADQIDEVISAGVLPSSLSEQLDAVRNIGNFAAHVQKSKHSGEVLPVEPQEAEWNLDVLEELFDHLFVKPAKAKARKDELNKKLAAAGKAQIP